MSRAEVLVTRRGPAADQAEMAGPIDVGLHQAATGWRRGEIEAGVALVGGLARAG